MARAEELAQEFHDKAQRQRDNILRDAAERLHLAEEREVLVAKAEAERHYRRVTQASELKMQGRLDQLRWEMVQTVQSRLPSAWRPCAKTAGYREWLVGMLREAAQLLPDREADRRGQRRRPALARRNLGDADQRGRAGPEITLSEQPTWGSGGLILRNADNSAQVDNRFEGRLARLEATIQRVILQQLFPADINASARSGGPQ
jgi:V/A-type H+-transporting ATPase subunit E